MRQSPIRSPAGALTQTLSQALTRAWTRRGALAWCLWPLSVLFGALVALRGWLYRVGAFKTGRVAAKVVVVGNVVAGGAGKTPVVMALVRHLQAGGWQVGVVSRGYGRHTHDCREVLADSPAHDVGDEPALIKNTCNAPVFVAKKRHDAAVALLAKYPKIQVIVCDDGLQHHALHRDLEICVFDDRYIGNGFLLPAGPLREPWPRSTHSREPWPRASNLSHASATRLVLHTGQRPGSAARRTGKFAGEFAGEFWATRALADHAVRSDGSTLALAALRGKPVAAVAGIANPPQFFSMLRDAGLTLTHAETLPDHYNYNSWICKWDAGYSLVCTEKDAIKLWRAQPTPHAQALAVPLVLGLDPAFLAALDAALA
jgi:tetraacyldisaccharide 4'-kinase